LNWPLYDAQATPVRNYVALLTNQGDKFSAYFTDWVNATDTVNAKVQSDILVNAIKNIGAPPGEDEVEFELRAFRSIAGYRKSHKGKVNIVDISQLLFADPDRIGNYILNELQLEIDSDIFLDAASLRKLVQIEASVKGINLTFEAGKFGNEVHIEDDLVIINSRDLVDQIRAQQSRPADGR
jgi:nucleoid-associated protein YejK